MSNKVLAKSFLIYGVGNMLYTAIILILIPIYLEKMAIEDYGLFSMYYVTGNLFSILFSLSISNGILRYYSEFEDEIERKKTVFSILLFFTFLFTILLSVLFFLPSKAFNWLGETSDLKYGLIIMLLWSFCRIYYNMILGVLRAKEKAVKYVILTILDVLILCVVNTIVIFYLDFNLYDILLGYLFSAFVSMLIGFLFIFKDIIFKFNTFSVKYILAYGIPLSIANVISYFTTYGNRYFLLYYTNKSNVAIFDVAQKITGVLGVILVNAFMISFTPYYLNLYSKNSTEEFQKNINRVINIFINIYFVFGLAIVVFDSYILDFLSKKEYISAALYIPFLIISNAFNVLFMLLTMSTNINKKTYVELIITIIMLVSGIIANIILIQKYGLLGASISQLLMSFIGFICINFYNLKNFPLNFNSKNIIVIVFFFILLSIGDFYINMLGVNLTSKLLLSTLMLTAYIFIIRKQLMPLYQIAYKFIKK